MVDIDAFSEENFDVKAWVNDAIRKAKAPEETLEATVGAMVLKLQVISQDLNKSLEETGQRAMQNLPKSLREMERLRTESTGLKQTTQSIASNLAQIEKETQGCITAIASVDVIKNKMEGCVAVLVDADNVARLARDIDKIFSAGDLQAIAEHLGTMQRSVQALRDVPEFAQYRTQVKSMQEKLEGMVSEKLMEALENRNPEGSKMYREILDKVGRVESVHEQYVQSRTKALLAAWASYTPWDAASRSDAPNAHLCHWLASFYDYALGFAHQEFTWCVQVFPEQKGLLGELIIRTFNNIGASLSQRADDVIRVVSTQAVASQLYDQVSGLEVLIDLHALSSSFALSIRELLQTARCDESVVDVVTMSIMQVYLPYLRDYRQLEVSHLTKNLGDIAQLEPEGISDTVSRVEDSVGRVMSHLTAAVERCIQFTGGTEADALVDAINDVLGMYASKIMAIIKVVRRLAHIDPEPMSPPGPQPITKLQQTAKTGSFKGLGPSAVMSTKGGHAGPAPPQQSGAATPGSWAFPTYQHDWTSFQGALQILQAGKHLAIKLQGLEDTVKSRVAENKDALLQPPSPNQAPSVHCIRLRQDKEKTLKLRALFKRIAEGKFKVISGAANPLQSLYLALRSLVYDSAFFAIKDRLINLPSQEAWTSEPQAAPNGLMLPTFSLSPLEYITQIGEHLLTLPQHLEPFANPDLPHVHILDPPQEDIGGDEGEEHGSSFAHGWITSVAKGTVALYLEQISRVPTVSQMGAKQLATDIGYLCNVLAALGVVVDPHLAHARQLLDAPKDEFMDVFEDNVGIDRKTAKMIAAMRGIQIKG